MNNGKFITLINRLYEKGIIPVENKKVWNTFRYLRNQSSHPVGQSIITPGMAIDTLKCITIQLDLLFNKKS